MIRVIVIHTYVQFMVQNVKLVLYTLLLERNRICTYVIIVILAVAAVDCRAIFFDASEEGDNLVTCVYFKSM